ncbi:hypothetical protein JW921_04195, partial [Candidatus Fermentibacterales bacterium]|nr:hypothetical protein [Candidatus Fermentibacterales bacterium]
MISFKVCASFEHSGLLEGIEELVRSELEGLRPPDWADEMLVSDTWDGTADALFFVFSDEPTTFFRDLFFSALRMDIPIGGLCTSDQPVSGDAMVRRLTHGGTLWCSSEPYR